MWRIWIDLNQDGEWADSNELVLDISMAVQGELQGVIQIPAPVDTLGNTRMRVSMKYEGLQGNSPPPTACEEFEFGEVEDYCLTILPSTVSIDPELEPLQVNIYPNPVREIIHIDAEEPIEGIRIYNLMGQLVWETAGLNTISTQIVSEMLANGLYQVEIKTRRGIARKQMLKQ